MDVVTLGAAINGAKEYTDGHFKAGTNIQFVENADGTVTMSASGDISSEDDVARGAISNHVADTNNPHSVTASDVGLGNVDNTSDKDKPVSDAVQAVFDTLDQNLTEAFAGVSSDLAEKQAVIDASHKVSSDYIDDTNKTNRFVTASEKQKIGAILNGEDYFGDAVALSAGDDLDTLSVGKYRVESSVVDNISHVPADNAFILFMLESTSDHYMQIAYVINSVNYYIRHGALANNLITWATWQTYTTQFDNSHKLSSDYVNDVDKTNKFVTDAEKTAIATIGDKVDKVSGKGLSTEDYTTAEKTKLAGLSNYNDTSIKAAIKTIANDGSKNMLKTDEVSRSVNNIVVTANSDGTYTVSIPENHGSSTTTFDILGTTDVPSRFYNRNLILSNTATGGGDNKWRMTLQNRTSTTSTIRTCVGGDSEPFTISDAVTSFKLILAVYANCPAMTLTIDPMIRDASITDSTYEPYAPTNRELYEMILASVANNASK